ncbi:MAG: ECF-type sigma factor [Pyrinomonadaceae bacterium]|nr:ECF-type sigma factor [Pyrinomonadaceae bacterium]
MVHEAYVRLANQSSISMENLAQFFGLAAKIMRDILVGHARKRLAAKRGGQQGSCVLTISTTSSCRPSLWY